MASRDGHNGTKAVLALEPAVLTTGATAGELIDTAGYESVEFVIAAGTLTDGSFTPSITAGDKSDGSDLADAAADIIGTIAGATFAATDDKKVKKFGYVGGKRYVKLTITAADAANGGPVGAVAILGHARSLPVA